MFDIADTISEKWKLGWLLDIPKLVKTTDRMAKVNSLQSHKDFSVILILLVGRYTYLFFSHVKGYPIKSIFRFLYHLVISRT